MSVLSWLRRRFRKDPGPATAAMILPGGYDYPPCNWDEDEPVTEALRAVESGYRPHGIDTREKLAELVAQAEATEGPRVPGYVPNLPPLPPYRPAVAPVAAAGPPPIMPYPSGLSRVMVNHIAYPDPAAAPSPDKDRHYRDMYRRVGVATGTRTPEEDTGTWPRLALEPGDGTGRQL